MSTWESLSMPMEAQMFALQVAISGAIVSGLVLLGARLLRRRSAPLRYGVLLAGVFGLLAVPALVGVGLNVPLVPAGDEIIKVSAEMLPAFLDRPPLEEPPTVEDVPSAVGETVGAVLLSVWGGLAILGLMRLLFGLWKQHRRIIGQPWSPAWWTDERQACLAQKVGLAYFPPVHSSPVAPMPMVVGLLRPKIVLPEQAPSLWGQPQWEAVLLHEAAHIARRDPWAAFAQCLAVILFWWCPLVHLMARRLNDLREAICDDYALEGPCDRLAYAELLVESAERLVNLRTMPVPVGLIDSARRGLEERITRLLAKEKEPMKKLSLAGKLLGASFLVAACLSISAATAFTQTPPAKKIQIKIILDGKEIDLDAASLAALLQAVQPKAEAAAKPADTFEKPTRIEVQLQAGQPGAAPQAIELAWKLVDANLNVTQVKPGAAPLQPDPRIEELVKQAEAIKPGSGADIRRALQAKAKPGNSYFHYNPTPDGKLYYAVPSTPATGHGQIEPGKHVIVLTVDASGKVAQLQGAELKKFLAAAEGDKKFAGDLRDYMEKAVSEAQRAEALKAEAMKAAKVLRSAKAGAPPSTATPPGMIAPVPPKMPVPAPPVPSGLPPARVVPAPPPAADVEALARQIDRITAELQELRKRLDANKK